MNKKEIEKAFEEYKPKHSSYDARGPRIESTCHGCNIDEECKETWHAACEWMQSLKCENCKHWDNEGFVNKDFGICLSKDNINDTDCCSTGYYKDFCCKHYEGKT